MRNKPGIGKWVSTLSLCLYVACVHAQDLSHLKNQKPFSFTGDISLTSGFYHAFNINERTSPFTWSVAASPVIGIYNFSLPFSFYISNYGRSFRQPFNQFGASPTYKWLTVHLGYRSVNYSPLILSGVSFVGVGIELNPSKFHTAFIYGRTARAVTADTSVASDVEPAFKRIIYGGRIGFGSSTSYCDFTFVKGKDDPSSLPEDQRAAVSPAENTALGFSLRLPFAHKKIMWSVDAGASAYSPNTLDSAFKPANDIEKDAERIMQWHYSSYVRTALQSTIALRVKSFGLQLQGKRIEPDYLTLGTYYTTGDVLQFSASPTFSFFKNKIILSANLLTLHDDMFHNKGYEYMRDQGALNLNIVPTRAFNLNLQLTVFDSRQSNGLLKVNDSTGLHQRLSSATLTPQWNMVSGSIVQVISASLNIQGNHDFNSYTAPYSQTNSLLTTLNYSRSNKTSHSGWSGGLHFNMNKNFGGEFINYGITGGIHHQWQQQKLSAEWREGVSLNSGTTANKGAILTSTLGATYKLLNNHFLTASFSLNNDLLKTNPFTEVRATISYRFTFKK